MFDNFAYKTRSGWLLGKLILMLTYSSLALLFPTLCVAEGGLSPLELAGWRIYQEGLSSTGEQIIAHLGLANIDVSAERFPCTNCHGVDGEELSEGSLTAPSLTWNLLVTPSRSATRTRPAYDGNTLIRAITNGYGAAGTQLHDAMPRYRMTEEQLAALIAYLKKLGSDADTHPSISPTSIRLGTRLPLTGPQAKIGKTLQATMKACLATVNSDGGIYGRTLELVAEDSESSENNEEVDNEPYAGLKPVFADLADYNPQRHNMTGIRSAVPLIGPITFMPKPNLTADENVFYLLPSLTSQARALVDFLAASPENTKLHLTIVHDGRETEITEAIRLQILRRNMVMPRVIKFYSNTNEQNGFVRKLTKFNTGAIFFIGDGDQFLRLGRYLEHDSNPPILLGLIAMIGRSALDLPNSLAAKTYLASPFAINDLEALEQLSARLRKQKIDLVNPGLQASACATIDIFAEAAKQCGRRLSRARLMKAMDQYVIFPAH
jgi:ABC-type branched-subunit amino acid transport system substrate-binding protein